MIEQLACVGGPPSESKNAEEEAGKDDLHTDGEGKYRRNDAAQHGGGIESAELPDTPQMRRPDEKPPLIPSRKRTRPQRMPDSRVIYRNAFSRRGSSGRRPPSVMAKTLVKTAKMAD